MAKNDQIFGVRSVMEAIHAGKEIEKVYIRRGTEGGLLKELFTLVRQKDVPFQIVPVEKLNNMVPQNSNHQGTVALMSLITYCDLETVINEVAEGEDTPLFLILDRVSDVRNFGAIARSAEVAGVHAIVIPDAGSARINGEAMKTSAGALHTLPICRVKNLKDAIYLFQQSDIKCIAATEKADNLYYNTDMKGPVAIVMGSEDKGISPTILKIVDRMMKIPQYGVIDSLNVSVASSLMIFESIRQRDPQAKF